MFTGIIEYIGVIDKLEKSNDFLKIQVSSNCDSDQIKIGESIAINGVCLTIEDILIKNNKSIFNFSIIGETIDKTNLGDLDIGSLVNLERAIKLSERLNGHMVQGHVESTGKIIDRKFKNDQVDILIQVQPELLKYCIVKGSIAIDGISLTIADIVKNKIKVAIIPHTIENTNLKNRKIGDFVNIETDIIAKYIENLIER